MFFVQGYKVEFHSYDVLLVTQDFVSNSGIHSSKIH